MVEFLFSKNRRLLPAAVYDFACSRPTRGRHPERLSPAPVFAVTSGKGGVGKTAVVANLAAALLQRNKRVMVIDADLGLANLHLFLGVHPIYTLADFFSGGATLEEIIVSSRSGILLLPGATGGQETTALRHEQKVALLTELDAMTHAVDLVLVDTGSGISDAVAYFTSAAQEIIVVVTPELSSMNDCCTLLRVLTSRHGQKRFWILPNSVSGKEEALRLFATLSQMALRFLNASLDLLGWIPRDSQLRRSVANAKMVVLDAPNSPSARSFVALAERLVEITTAGVNLKDNLQFFFRQMVDSKRGMS